MSTLREAAEKALALLADESVVIKAPTVAKWTAIIHAVATLRAELAKPDARPAPAEPQPAAQQERKPLTDEPIEAAEWERECDDTDTILRALGLDPARCRTDGGSLKVQMIVGALAKPAAAPEGWQLVPVAITDAMVEAATARHSQASMNLNSWQAMRRALEAALAHVPPQVQRAGLTDEQIDRHSIAAADCPPSSTVILVSSLRRLLGITATKGDNHA